MSGIDNDAWGDNESKLSFNRDRQRFTHSLPVQYVLASLASQVTTPRSSSGLPIRPIGFWLDHLSSRPGCVSRYAAVSLMYYIVSFKFYKLSVSEGRTSCRCNPGSVSSLGFASGLAHRPCYAPSAIQRTWMCCTTPMHGPAI